MPTVNARPHFIEPGHWAERRYFNDMRPFLNEISRCDPQCAPNYLVNHIGVFHCGERRAFNFVGLAGSRRQHFSIEIKTDENQEVMNKLWCRGWDVEPYHTVRGYRVHLPQNLGGAEAKMLRDLMGRAYEEWPLRQARK